MYKKETQLAFEDFIFPFGELDSENEWVKLAGLITSTLNSIRSSFVSDALNSAFSTSESLCHCQDRLFRIIDCIFLITCLYSSVCCDTSPNSRISSVMVRYKPSAFRCEYFAVIMELLRIRRRKNGSSRHPVLWALKSSCIV